MPEYNFGFKSSLVIEYLGDTNISGINPSIFPEELTIPYLYISEAGIKFPYSSVITLSPYPSTDVALFKLRTSLGDSFKAFIGEPDVCFGISFIWENLVYSHKLYYNTDPLGLISVSK